MVEQDLRLLVSVVVSAEDERQAHDACRDLVNRIGGRIVGSGDCSDEEPGCWSVTIGKEMPGEPVHNDAAVLARAVRSFVRELAPDSPLPRVSCEPPTAWTVLDEPELVGTLATGAERLLVEAWAGQVPYLDPVLPPSQPVASASPVATDEPATWLRLRVDVAAKHPAGAQWQARALASRVVESATITHVEQHHDRVSVHLDLGHHGEPPERVVHAAAEALGRPEWTPLSWHGGAAVLRWIDLPMPASGIVALELTAEGTAGQHASEPEVVWPTEDEPPMWTEPRS